MSSENAKRDDNKVTTLMAVTDNAAEEIRPLLVDPTTGRLLVSAVVTVSSIDDVGDVSITSVADNEVLAYDNATSEWINQTAAEAGLAPALGADENYVTDADITLLGNTSGANSGDQNDHGTLDGLLDDDHTQYIKDTEFTANSGILVGTGAGTFAEETGATLRTSIGCDATGTDNSTDVSLNAALTDILSLTTQELGAVDNGSDAVVGWDETASKLTYLSAADVRTAIDVDASGTDNSTDVTIGTASGLSLIAQALSLAVADTDTTGALSDTDWNTFNGKADALGADDNYVTDADITLLGNTSGANTGDEVAGTVSTAGVLELATNAETLTGTDTARAVTPDDVEYARPQAGWIPVTDTWTYSSVDDPTGIITVPTDATTKYSAGMRISFVNATNTIYGIITAVTATTITFLHEIDPTDSLALYLMADSAITVPKYSTQKAPFGFPLDPDKWSVELVYSTTVATADTAEGTVVSPGTQSIDIPIGSWNVEFSGLASVTCADASNRITISAALSTANNSVSDTEMQASYTLRTATAIHARAYCNFFLRKNINLTTKDTYYPVTFFDYGGSTNASIYFYADPASNGQSLIIKAVCAYL